MRKHSKELWEAHRLKDAFVAIVSDRSLPQEWTDWRKRALANPKFGYARLIDALESRRAEWLAYYRDRTLQKHERWLRSVRSFRVGALRSFSASRLALMEQFGTAAD